MKAFFVKRRRLLKILLCAVLLALVLIGIVNFLIQARKSVGFLLEEHMAEVSGYASSAIKLELTGSLRQLEYTAALLCDQEDYKAHVSLALEELKKHSGFSQVYYVDDEDDSIGPQGKEGLESAGFLAAMGRGGGITRSIALGPDGEEALFCYAPLRVNSALAGGVVGEYPVKKLDSVLRLSGFESRGEYLLLDAGGKLITGSDFAPLLEEGENFYEVLRGYEGQSVDVDAIKHSIQNGGSGMFTSQTADGGMIYYAPVGINDWCLVTIMPSQVIQGMTGEFNSIAMALTSYISVAALGLLLMMLFDFKRSRNNLLRAMEETEKSNKKFELAIRNSSSYMFEYDIEQDALTFLTSSADEHPKFYGTVQRLKEEAVERGIMLTEGLEELERVLEKVKGGSQEVVLEFVGGKTFEGQTWLKATLSPLESADGLATKLIGSIEDVTPVRVAQNRYAREERLRRTMIGQMMAVWSANLDTGRLLSYMEGSVDIFHTLKGKGLEELFFGKMLKNVAPEDRNRVADKFNPQELKRAFSSGIEELKESFRIVMDGREVWVDSIANLLADPSTGEPVVFSYTKNIDNEKRRELALVDRSDRDYLTKLYNRSAIERKISEALQNPAEGGVMCLMMMDVDGFKSINDSLGHKMGDSVITGVGAVLGEIFAQDLVGRLGGDEFIAFVSNADTQEQVWEKANLVCTRIRVLYQYSDVPVTISVGVAFAPEEGASFSTLYQRADKALYYAKHQGKNRVC